MSINTLPPLRTRAEVERNLRVRTAKRIAHKKEGLGEKLAHITGSIDRSIPIFNVPIEAGQELGEAITGSKGDKSKYLNPGEDAAKVTGGAVKAIPVVGAAAELGEDAGKAVTEHAGQITSATEAVGSLALKLNEVKTWVRIGKVLAGVLIIIFALILILKVVNPGAAGTATELATRGAKHGIKRARAARR